MTGSHPACMQVWEEIHISVFSYTRCDHQGFPFTLLGVTPLLITTTGLVCAKETQPLSTAGCLEDISTFICVCKTRADLVASAACLLAWLSWISISLRSPSIFFLSRMASFLLRASESRVDCSESMARCWFLLKRTWRMDGMIFLSVQGHRSICSSTSLSGSVSLPEIVYFWLALVAHMGSIHSFQCLTAV